MRIINLRRKIILNAFGSVFLIFSFAAVVFFIYKYKENFNIKVQEIKSSTINLKSKTIALQIKIDEALKYKKIWDNIDENKKNTQPIKMDEINKIIKESAQKNNIKSEIIQITVPTPIFGSLARETLIVSSASGTLSFQAYDDISALKFINDFQNKIQGYAVITSVDFTKNKNYKPQDIIEISLGKGQGIINVKISFFWYSYKEKETPENQIKSGN